MTTTELSYRLAGGLYESGDPEYEDACGLFNSMVATRPRMVARCSAPEDVVAALAYAREHGLPVAVRAGGHSVAGHSLCEGLVLDVRGLDDVEVDAERRIARVGGGATWAAVDRATQAHGLATTGGRVSTTGVAGLTLGGGSGWLERKHGLACDNLLAVELVTADGRTVRASDDKHPELLWALRGGGGNFGVVTALEFRLHPLGPEVTAGLALYPAAEGAALLARWGDAMRSAPAEVGLAFAYLTAPEEPSLPAELHGQTVAAIAGLYAGPPDEGERVLRPFLELATPAFDGFQPMPYVDFQCSLDDPPGCRNYWSAEHLDELPPAAVERIHACGTALPSAGSSLFVVPWGGRVADGNGPLAGRDARFVVHPLALWEDPADDERAIGWVRGLRAGLADHATGAAYLNWTGDEGRVVSAYGEANHARLALIKAEWDAGDAFVAGGHVPPAGPAAPRVTRLASGIELAAVATGPPGGEPVVLLHGLFDHWRSFEPVLRHLSGDLRAYALTQRGHTGSSCPASGYAIADLAADVLGFLDAHGIERALLAGHSLGALAALQAAIHAPDRVSGLVLAPGFAQARETVAVKELLQAVQEMGPELERAFAELLQEDAHTHSASFFDAMVGHTLQMPAAVCRALLESITAFDATDALERVRAPALVVWGDADAIVPRAQVEALVAGLPDAELRVYHGCGHTPHWHDARRFARDLACFAERVAARRAFRAG